MPAAGPAAGSGSTSGTSSSSATSCLDSVCKNALSIFEAGIESVLPRRMIERELKVNNNTLTVRNKSYKLDHNVYIVGFGKAVIGMVRAAEDILGEHIVRGIASIPIGIQDELKTHKKFDMLPGADSKVELCPGGDNGQPDQPALEATERILTLAEDLTAEHVLLVFISGGGSVLSPAPPPSISIEEFATIGLVLRAVGAPNSELNVVRKHMSRIKAGQLAKKAYPTTVISLILSDSVGNQLDIIAGGPTTPNYGSAHASMNVINKYNLNDAMPKSVMDYLTSEIRRMETERAWNEESQEQSMIIDYNQGEHREFDHVQNVLIGSNFVAVQAAKHFAQSIGYVSFVMGSTLTGLSLSVGKYVGDLAFYALLLFDLKRTKSSNDRRVGCVELDMIRKHKVSKNELIQLNKYVEEAYNTRKPLCIITSANTDVKIHSPGQEGVGGPNQEVVCAASLVFNELIHANELDKSYQVVLLSGDSDGRDGNSSAAGALTYPSMVEDAAGVGELKLQDFLDNNDTHTFFQRFRSGDYCFYTGMTGTNVMDIQVLLIKLDYGVLQKQHQITIKPRV